MLLHHIAAVVRDFEPPQRLFKALGLRVGMVCPDGPFGCKEMNVESAPVLLCLFRPETDDNPMGRWLKCRGPGLHHLMFDTDNLPELIQTLSGRGIRFAMELQERPWQFQAFVNPKQSCGGLIELGEWWGRTGPLRPRPAEPTLDHLSWAVRDIQAARTFFSQLGLEVSDAHPDTPVFACDHVSVRSIPCGISIKAPAGEGPFARHLAKHGPGLHHICFSVADLRTTAQELRKAGFRLVPDEPIPEPHQLTWFVHPKDVEGILIELGEPVRNEVKKPAPATVLAPGAGLGARSPRQ